MKSTRYAYFAARSHTQEWKTTRKNYERVRRYRENGYQIEHVATWYYHNIRNGNYSVIPRCIYTINKWGRKHREYVPIKERVLERQRLGFYKTL